MHRILWVIILLAAAVTTSDSTRTGAGDWPMYGADSGGSKYSPLKTIDRTNVAALTMAWTFSTGEPLEHLPHSGKPPSFEATPIVIDGVMYIGTPYGHVFALDAATGAKKWTYDAHIDVDGNYGDFANRGVSSWLGQGHQVGRQNMGAEPQRARQHHTGDEPERERTALIHRVHRVV